MELLVKKPHKSDPRDRGQRVCVDPARLLSLAKPRPTQSAVRGYITDHHNAGTVVSKGPLIYDARPLGSTATIVWMRYRNYGLQPDRKTAIAMMGSILSDTQNLKTSATDADREALKALSELGGVTDIDSFFKDMYKASISYSGMTDEEIFFSDYKAKDASSKIMCIFTKIFKNIVY